MPKSNRPQREDNPPPPLWHPKPDPDYTGPPTRNNPPLPANPGFPSDLERAAFAKEAFDMYLRHTLRAIDAYNEGVEAFQNTGDRAHYDAGVRHYETEVLKRQFDGARWHFDVVVEEISVNVNQDYVLGIVLRGATRAGHFGPRGPGPQTDAYSSSSSSSYPLIPSGFPSPI